MNDYIIYTDSACDIKKDLLAKWGVYNSSLTFQFDDNGIDYKNEDMPVKEFYDRMRTGGVAKTSAINTGTFLAEFEKLLRQGLDILYLGFSTGLSTTCNSAEMAAQQLREQYPERKIITIDTLSASVGEGLLVYLTVEKKKAGATLEEAAAFAEDMKLKIYHYVTVDDLVYLKRGGRISPTVAFVGNVLGLKPMIYVDNEGKLINSAKVRGRKKAIASLADAYTELAADPENGTVFIGHSDCLEDAQELARLLKERHGVKVKLITDIGTVIGAHTGPGAMVVCFVANGR